MKKIKMAQKTYPAKVLANQSIAQATPLLTLAKPAGYTFTAGQFVKLILPPIKSPDPLANWRWFSMASAPSEPALLFCYRRGQSEFKKVLENLSVGETIEISEAKGKFTLPPTTQKLIVFLAGGVGITPARSMIMEATKKKSPQKMTLLYSNYRPEDTPFLAECQNLNNPNFQLVATMTDLEKSNEKWPGETGFIDWPMIKRHLPQPQETLYYIVGSPGFCQAMAKMLEAAKIKKENIILEKFTGL